MKGDGDAGGGLSSKGRCDVWHVMLWTYLIGLAALAVGFAFVCWLVFGRWDEPVRESGVRLSAIVAVELLAWPVAMPLTLVLMFATAPDDPSERAGQAGDDESTPRRVTAGPGVRALQPAARPV